MTLLRVRRAAQLTLPADVRQALNVQEGDYLEAKIVDGGVMLKPVSVVERRRAWKSIEANVSKVRDRGGRPSVSDKSEEEAIADEVSAARHHK